MRHFKKYTVWQEGIELFSAVYSLTKGFPKGEAYGITSQMRRSALSVPSNIAEGCGRKSDKEFARYLTIALGSLYELETQVIACEKVGLLNSSHANLKSTIEDLRRKLIALIGSLKQSQ